MRILTINAGVFDSVFAPHNVRSGHEVTVPARGKRLEALQRGGVVIREQGSQVRLCFSGAVAARMIAGSALVLVALLAAGCRSAPDRGGHEPAGGEPSVAHADPPVARAEPPVGMDSATSAPVSRSATPPRAGTLLRARLDTGAVLLADGRVLVTGGTTGAEGDALGEGLGASVELYDPASGTSTAGPPMQGAHWRHTTTLLHDGRALVVGGIDGLAPGAELFDGAGWQPTAGLAPTGTVIDLSDSIAETWSTARHGHTATLLADGRVLVCGGLEPSRGSPTARAELFDPQTGAWTAAAPMLQVRDHHTATPLADGRVLVAGGRTFERQGEIGYLAHAEIYDPVADRWEALPPLSRSRAHHAAVALADGRALVVGGLDHAPGRTDPATGWPTTEALTSAERFDPATNAWSAGPPLATARFKHTASTLPDGSVLVAGGWTLRTNQATSEWLAPAAAAWAPGPPLRHPRDDHAAVVVGDAVLLFGGQDGEHRAVATVDALRPAVGAIPGTE